MSARRTERLLNLVICLLATRRYLGREQIRVAVPQYAECETDEAFERMFERDKEDLREMGIPLVTGSNSAFFDDEVGYRIDREAYALPEVSFAPDEMAVLGLAARVWQRASLGEAAAGALLKLRASGVDVDEGSIVGVEPRVRASEPAFAPLYTAVRDRHPVAFPYRSAGSAEVVERRLEPWGIVSWHGHWYAVGRDVDRDAPRVFRLSRIGGEVRPTGPAGSVHVPEDVDVREQVRMLARPHPIGLARVRLRPGAGLALRRRATLVGPAGEGWEAVEIRFEDEEVLADEVVALGAAAVVDEPAGVRDAVLRRLRGVVSASGGADAPGVGALGGEPV